MILAFNPSGLGALVLSWLHSQPIPVVHDICDLSLTTMYEKDGWFKCWLKVRRTFLGRVTRAALRAIVSVFVSTTPTPIVLSRSYFRSCFLKQRMLEAGLDVGQAPVIYHGLKPLQPAPTAASDAPLDIIFVGRLEPQKGAHVLLEAAGLLKDSALRGRRLTIVGPQTHAEYWHKLDDLAKKLEGAVAVEFTGQVPRERVFSLLREHGIFAFPVVWDEPFGLAPLEAMSQGLAVVATGTGGTAEYLSDGVNCLLVPKEDPRRLAEALERLLSDSSLRRRLADGGFRTLERFDFERRIDEVERHLEDVVRRHSRGIGQGA